MLQAGRVSWPLAVGVLFFAGEAAAWKPFAHVLWAEKALEDVGTKDGKPCIYFDRTNFEGKDGNFVMPSYREKPKIGVLRARDPKDCFPANDKMLQAIKEFPHLYFAGVVGPDVYPDTLTGSFLVHPQTFREELSDTKKYGPEAEKFKFLDQDVNVDGPTEGTQFWLRRLWAAANVGQDASPKALAFTAGILAHAAGDIYMHSFVNRFSGGSFEMFDLKFGHGIKHLTLEGYIGSRTPDIDYWSETEKRPCADESQCPGKKSLYEIVGGRDLDPEIVEFNAKYLTPHPDVLGEWPGNYSKYSIPFHLTDHKRNVDKIVGKVRDIGNWLRAKKTGLQQEIASQWKEAERCSGWFDGCCGSCHAVAAEGLKLLVSFCDKVINGFSSVLGWVENYARDWKKNIDDALRDWGKTWHKVGMKMVFHSAYEDDKGRYDSSSITSAIRESAKNQIGKVGLGDAVGLVGHWLVRNAAPAGIGLLKDASAKFDAMLGKIKGFVDWVAEKFAAVKQLLDDISGWNGSDLQKKFGLAKEGVLDSFLAFLSGNFESLRGIDQKFKTDYERLDDLFAGRMMVPPLMKSTLQSIQDFIGVTLVEFPPDGVPVQRTNTAGTPEVPIPPGQARPVKMVNGKERVDTVTIKDAEVIPLTVRDVNAMLNIEAGGPTGYEDLKENDRRSIGQKTSTPRFRWQEFPPAFNTVQVIKMSLLSAEGLSALAKAGNPNAQINFAEKTEYEFFPHGGTSRVKVETPTNVMLSGIKTLDGSNQWSNVGIARDCTAYQAFFMKQLVQEGFDATNKVKIGGKEVTDPRSNSEQKATCTLSPPIVLEAPAFPLYPGATATVKVVSSRANAMLETTSPGWKKGPDGRSFSYRNFPAPETRRIEKLTVIDREANDLGSALVTLEPNLVALNDKQEVEIGSKPFALDLKNGEQADIRWRISANDRRDYGKMGDPARVKSLESAIAAKVNLLMAAIMEEQRGNVLNSVANVVSNLFGKKKPRVDVQRNRQRQKQLRQEIKQLKEDLNKERAIYYPAKTIAPLPHEKAKGWKVPVRIAAEDFGPLDGERPRPSVPLGGYRRVTFTLQLKVPPAPLVFISRVTVPANKEMYLFVSHTRRARPLTEAQERQPEEIDDLVRTEWRIVGGSGALKTEVWKSELTPEEKASYEAAKAAREGSEKRFKTELSGEAEKAKSKAKDSGGVETANFLGLLSRMGNRSRNEGDDDDRIAAEKERKMERKRKKKFTLLSQSAFTPTGGDVTLVGRALDGTDREIKVVLKVVPEPKAAGKKR